MKQHRLFVEIAFWSSVGLFLGACDSGGGKGGPNSSPPPPEVSILSPSEGDVRNLTTPSVLASFDGAELDLGSIDVRVDGNSVLLVGWVITSRGISGSLPLLADGTHELVVSLQNGSGSTGNDVVVFETSTGGGPTRIRGVLLDPDGDVPIAGASIYIEEGPDVVATTGTDGSYLLEDGASLLPTGEDLHVLFDPRGIELEDEDGVFVYPLYKRKVDIVAGALNQLAPCFLPRVRPRVTFEELAHEGVFDCASQRFLQPYELSVDVGAGTDEELIVTLTVPANVYVDFLDGASACDDGMYLAIAPVDKHKAPSSLPPGADPSLLVTVQPTGMKFRVSQGGSLASLPISFPNRDAFPAETEMILFSVDHDTGEFAPMGTMQVDPSDTDRIVTVDGGLEGGSWHCSCPPEPEAQGDPEGFPGCGFDQLALNPVVDSETGFYIETYDLPTRRLYDENWGDALVYNSLSQTDRTILSADVEIPLRSAVPERVSVALSLAGLPIGDPIWFDTASLPEDQDSAISLPIPLDVELPTTGLYPYQLAITNHYPTSSVTSFVSGTLPRIVPESSPFGRGWALASDSRVMEAVDGSLLLIEAGASLSRFEPSILSDSGLDLTFYAYEGSPGAYWENRVTQFFEGVSPVSFVERIPGEEPVTRLETVIPSMDFPPQSSSAYFLYAGPNGEWDSSSQGDPDGDDVSYEVGGKFGALFEGYVYIPYSDTVRFSVEWDNGAALEVNGVTVLAQRGSIGTTYSEPLELEAGLVPIRLAFFDYGVGRRLKLFVEGAGYDASRPIPPSALFREANLVISNTYSGTRGDFSTLTALDAGGYVRDFPDGARESFDADGRLLSRADRRGRANTYQRSAETGQLTAIVDPAGGSTQFTRQAGRVSAITDPVGRTTTLNYQGSNLTSIENPADAVRRFEYDASGLLISTRDEDGHENQYVIDSGGRLVGVAYSDEASVTLTPFNNALLATLADGAGSSADDPAQPVIPGTVGAEFVGAGGRTSLQFEQPVFPGEFAEVPQGARLWLRRSEVGPGELLWNLRVSDASSGATLVEQVRVGSADEDWREAGVEAEIRTNSDDLRGLPLRRVESGLGLAPDRITEYEWHAEAAWLSSVLLGAGGVGETRLSIVRDDVGNVLQLILPTDTGGTAARVFEYEGAGFLMSSTDANGLSQQFGYDPVTRSLASITLGGETTTLELDESGQVGSITRPDGATTTYERDTLGQLTSVTDPAGAVTRQGYLPSGRLAWARGGSAVGNQGGLRHEFDYDGRGRLSKWSNPLGATHSFDYFDDGMVRNIVDPHGAVESRLQDAAGRLVRIEYRSAQGGQVSEAIDYTWNPLGRLTSVSTGNSTVLLSYSPFGELLREEQRLADADTAVVNWSYDELGRPQQMTSSVDGTSLVGQARVYGLSGSLQKVLATLPGFFGEFRITRDDTGRRTRLERPFDVDTFYEYDVQTGLIQGLETSSNGMPLGGDSLQRDEVLDISSITQVRALLDSGTLTAAHDALSRLTGWTSTEIPDWNSQFGPYDAQGNALGAARQFDVTDRLLEDETFRYDYDAAGNVEHRTSLDGSVPTLTYEWNLRGQLSRILEDGQPLAEFAYDGLGRRIRFEGQLPNTSTWSAERYVYDKDDLIGINREAGADAAVLHGPGVDEPWAVSEAGEITLLVADALGSVTQRLVAGTVVSEARYGPFGELVAGDPEPGALTVFGYRGRLFDQTTGLYDNRARYYDPRVGRFLSRDSLELASLGSLAPHITNPYSYGASSPLMYSDPSGRLPFLLIVGAALGAYQGYSDFGFSGAIIGAATGLLAPSRPITAAVVAVGGYMAGAFITGRPIDADLAIDTAVVAVSALSGAAACRGVTQGFKAIGLGRYTATVPGDLAVFTAGFAAGSLSEHVIDGIGARDPNNWPGIISGATDSAVEVLQGLAR